jgi:hypothetical protein
MVILITVLLVVSFALFFISCTNDGEGEREYPAANICIFSDPHFFDPDLGTSGAAFEDSIAASRKLVAESEEILKSLVSALRSEDIDIVLVPGDLTKDGERASHQKFAHYLTQMENAGMQVYVVPGNHDINNPHAVSYLGDVTVPVANVSATQFAGIYGEFGFKEAIARDVHSLSYVAEPVRGLWVIAMDSCRYGENIDDPVTGGKFFEETLGWIKEMLKKAHSEEVSVLGMMHHGLLEHFSGQKLFFSDYVIDKWNTIAGEFAELGLKVVFTGHFHAQDIVRMDTDTGDSGFIVDIETGSLVTFPCPYRIIYLGSDQTLSIATRKITQIDYDTGGIPFQDYAREFLEDGLVDEMTSMMVGQFPISADDAGQIAPYMASGMIAHYMGDESPSQEIIDFIQQLLSNTDIVKRLIGQGLDSIWTDLEPPDNDIVIDLADSR